MPTVELTKNRLAALLQRAMDAYQVREEQGPVDQEWAEWCAEFVMEELGAEDDRDGSDDLDVLGG